MTFAALSALLAHQWQGYAERHQSRFNLAVHVVAVPVFMIASTGLAWAAWWHDGWLALGALGALALSLAAQGRGHRRERVAPEPFRGPWNAIARLLAEQWITFPRFLLSGRWWATMRQREQV